MAPVSLYFLRTYSVTVCFCFLVSAGGQEGGCASRRRPMPKSGPQRQVRQMRSSVDVMWLDSLIRLNLQDYVVAKILLTTVLVPKGPLEAELVPVLVDEWGHAIGQTDLEDAKFLKRVQLISFAEAV